VQFFVSATAGNAAPTISSVGNDTPSMLTVAADTTDHVIRTTVQPLRVLSMMDIVSGWTPR
jgi:hypothetical protein